jgi:HEPN domain-containing protein
MKLAETTLTDIICFHCQQCAEKYLKALLVFNGVHFPKTHDLRTLLELSQKSSRFEMKWSQIVSLNRYTIEGRYPGDWEPISKEEVIVAIETAVSVREAVRLLLPYEIINPEHT